MEQFELFGWKTVSLELHSRIDSGFFSMKKRSFAQFIIHRRYFFGRQDQILQISSHKLATQSPPIKDNIYNKDEISINYQKFRVTMFYHC